VTGRRLGLTIGLAIAACLLVGRAVAGWLVDYRWYQSLDATPVFWAAVTNLAMLRGAAFLAGTVLCFANLYAVRFSIVSVILPRRVGNLEIGEELQGRSLALFVLVVSVAMGALLALPSGDWISLDLVRHGNEFRESDPYFGLDLAFWVYWLPLEEALHAWTTFALLLIAGVSVFLYALTPSLRWQEGRLHVSGHVRRHLLVLCSLLLLLLGWSYRLDALSLLLDGEGTGRAFLAIDHRIGIPGRLVLAMASVVCAMLVAWAGWVGQLRVVLAALAILSVGAIGMRQVLPPLAARFLDPSDPERRDRPYRMTRAAFSRRAFDVALLEVGDTLQGVTVPRSVPPLAAWDVEAIRASAATWGPSGQPTATIGWMQRNGRPQAVVVDRAVGPNAASRPGVTLVDAAGRGSDGQLLRVEDEVVRTRVLPPVAVGDSLPEGGVVADSSNAIAAPMLETLTSRIVHAWGLQNPRLLRAQSTFGPTRLVRIRDVRTRVGRIFPFFVLGNRVLPLVVRDSLVWAVHLYAASSHYPLSEPIVLEDGDVSYFKHAGVAIVNAHTGRVFALRPSEADPVARSWYRRFPGLFVLASAASEDLLRQVPPPVEGVLTQARAYARFGRRGDALVPPSQLARDTGADSGFSFPGLTPFVDASRRRLAVAYPVLDPTDRLRGVVLGSGGADSRTAWLPLRGPDRQWREVIETLRQQLDSVAAAQRGRPAPLLRGPVRVAVHEGAMIPFQVAYHWEGDRAPLMEWIAIAMGDRTRVGRTTGTALGFPEPDPTDGPLTPEEFRRRVAALYVTMDDALGRRDMLTFGEAWTALGRVLRGAPQMP
jgi:hypothetical protein